MRSGVSLRAILNVMAAWIAANGVAFFAIDCYERSQSPAARSPTRQALRAFQVSNVASSLPYRIMPPQSVARGVKYPLVVFLHGAGEKGDNNRNQLFGLPEQLAESSWRDDFPCYVLAPQCPSQSYWTSHDAELIALIKDVMKSYPIDQERIYLTGLSMGGFGSWSLATREPELFAAVVPICGGGNPDSAARLTTVPIWAVHGDADTTVSVEASRRMIAAIEQAGGKPKYTELPGVGHNSWTATYRDPQGVLKWMFEQRNRRAGSSSRASQ